MTLLLLPLAGLLAWYAVHAGWRAAEWAACLAGVSAGVTLLGVI